MDARILEHLDLVIEANKTTNITRIDSRERGLVLHVEDSLSALPEIQAAPDGLLADMGSGAGYPGIPLAIETGRDTVLVESVKKKAAFLRDFVNKLGLAEQVSVYAGRAEEAEEYFGKCAVVTARALSKLSVLMELASPLLQNNGVLISYKANVTDEEYEHAVSLLSKLGYEIVSDRSFVLSDGESPRRIIVFRKTRDAAIFLPRRAGFAQKKPL